MNTRTLALVCVAALAAVTLFWFGQLSTREAHGAHLGPQEAAESAPEVEVDAQLANVPQGEAGRMESNLPPAESAPAPAAGATDWATAVPKDDGVTGWDLAPLNVQVIDSISGERVPFLSFIARDARGETLLGCTDADGRVRSYEELATGTVHVEITIGAHADDQVFGVGTRSAPGRRGAVLSQPKQAHDGDDQEPSVWRLKAQRVVPLAIDLPAELMDQAEVWLASAAVDRQVQRVPLAVSQLRNVSADQLMGATHVVELASAGLVEAGSGTFIMGGRLGNVEDWLQGRAGQRVLTRKLYVVVANAGELLFASVPVPELPLMGEAPIRLTPAPSSASALPSAFLRDRYGKELGKQAALIAALATRQDFRLSGVVTSNSGDFGGMVFVRANPMGEEDSDALDRRKQWIMPRWTQGEDGRSTAPFVLDELDAGQYRITAFTGDGVKVSDSPYTIDTTDPEPAELSFTVLD